MKCKTDMNKMIMTTLQNSESRFEKDVEEKQKDRKAKEDYSVKREKRKEKEVDDRLQFEKYKFDIEQKNIQLQRKEAADNRKLLCLQEQYREASTSYERAVEKNMNDDYIKNKEIDMKLARDNY